MSRIGGSFAPPLDTGKLQGYRDLSSIASAPVKEVMLKLAKMVEVFQKTPTSTLPGTPHPVGIGMIVPLEQAEIERIDEHVPYDHEIDSYRALFDALPTGTAEVRGVTVVVDQAAKSLRDAAFHLLWFAIELARDREPLTSDKL